MTNWRKAKNICIKQSQREKDNDSAEDTFREETTKSKKEMNG
jgi:hypothetical protein